MESETCLMTFLKGARDGFAIGLGEGAVLIFALNASNAGMALKFHLEKLPLNYDPVYFPMEMLIASSLLGATLGGLFFITHRAVMGGN